MGSSRTGSAAAAGPCDLLEGTEGGRRGRWRYADEWWWWWWWKDRQRERERTRETDASGGADGDAEEEVVEEGPALGASLAQDERTYSVNERQQWLMEWLVGVEILTTPAWTVLTFNKYAPQFPVGALQLSLPGRVFLFPHTLARTHSTNTSLSLSVCLSDVGSVVCVRSNRWPGAVSVAAEGGKRWSHVYIGYGHKVLSLSLSLCLSLGCDDMPLGSERCSEAHTASADT
jgi:hypothetical protein